MEIKQLKYAIAGLGCGLILGVLVGFGGLNFIKKSQRRSVMPFAVGITAVVFSGFGFNIGRTLGRNIYIEETLGINNSQDEFYKDGRYWVAITTLTDKRDGKNNTLVTKRSSDGLLTTFLNNHPIINHDLPNANRQTVPKYHNNAKADHLRN